MGEWTDPVPISGIDGQPGEDGVDIEFIYQLTKTEEEKPDKPESVQEDDAVPEDEVDQIILYLLVRNINLNGFVYVRKIMVFDQNGQNHFMSQMGS